MRLYYFTGESFGVVRRGIYGVVGSYVSSEPFPFDVSQEHSEIETDPQQEEEWDSLGRW